MAKIFLTILATILISQDTRYIDEVFDSVDITQDVVYGNSPDLPFFFLFEWNTNDIDLEMDNSHSDVSMASANNNNNNKNDNIVDKSNDNAVHNSIFEDDVFDVD